MSPWLELSTNNTLISVSDPLNIWPQNNKQILYCLTQFHQTPVSLEKTLSVSTVVKTQIIFPPNYAWIAECNFSKNKVYLKIESSFVYTHQPQSLKKYCYFKRKHDTFEIIKVMCFKNFRLNNTLRRQMIKEVIIKYYSKDFTEITDMLGPSLSLKGGKSSPIN